MTTQAADFDRKFDKGEDLSDLVDWSAARRPNLESTMQNGFIGLGNLGGASLQKSP
jgi:hypothetical protein